jgi:NAD(P)-dependent dehydrogenase (short-subunit alcohol dehydrogenase family)
MNTTPVALVTAASRGIGAAIVRELVARGYHLVVMSRTSEEGTAMGSHVISLQGDVTNPADLAGLVDTAMTRFGRIDAVVNNTGHSAKGPLLELTDDEWHQGLDILVLNVIRMARLVTPIMQQQQSGAIVNISSYVAVKPELAYPVSATLRPSLDNFARLYSQQHAKDGIRMNNVLPGKVDTGFPLPTREGVRPEDVARVVAHLVSPETRYVTGQSIVVDGGLTA